MIVIQVLSAVALALGPLERNHPLVERGLEAYQVGRYQEALRAFEEAKEKLPDSAAVEFDRANTLYRMGRFDEAKDGYLRAQGLADQRLTEPELYNLGNALAQQGDLKGAAEAYRKALRQDPTDEAARHNLEVALRKLKPPPPQSSDGGADGGSGRGPDAGSDGGEDAGRDAGRDGERDGGQGGRGDGGHADGGIDGGRGGERGRADGGQEDGGENRPEPGAESRAPDRALPDGGEGLSPQEAEQLLDAVKQNEKNLQLWRFQKKKPRRPNEKDW